jgi:hypothetical protein
MEQVKDHGLCDISYSFIVVREACTCRTCKENITDAIAIRQTLQGKITNYYHRSCMKRDKNIKDYLRLHTNGALP